jgi:hypothetical protein
VKWTQNAPDEYQLHFPKGAYAMTDVGALVNSANAITEIQVYRNNDLLTWGPVVQLQAGGGDAAVTLHGQGADWYLKRRFIDGEITNLLTNGDFESGTSGWTSVTSGGGTISSDTSKYQVGTHSIKIVGATGGDNELRQRISVPPNGVGNLMTLGGWFFIDTFNGPNNLFVGLYMEGFKNGVSQGNNYFPIDSATPRGQWYKTSQFAPITMWVPPNEEWQFDIRVFGINGTIYWDEIKFVPMYSTSTSGITHSATDQTDIANIVKLIVSAVQTNPGKSGVNIGSNTATTGITQVRAYQWVDHVQFDTAINEFIQRDDGIDYFMDYTPTTRTFTTTAGKRGVDRTGSITLKFVAGDTTSNCVDYKFSEDAGHTITRQVVLGEDNGPDREQGDATNATSTGGIVLEDVRQAPQLTKVGSLQPIARERLARYGTRPHTITMLVKGSSGLIPTLKCGDFVVVDISDGFVSVNANYRIQMMELDCKTNILAVTLATDELV